MVCGKLNTSSSVSSPSSRQGDDCLKLLVSCITVRRDFAVYKPNGIYLLGLVVVFLWRCCLLTIRDGVEMSLYIRLHNRCSEDDVIMVLGKMADSKLIYSFYSSLGYRSQSGDSFMQNVK